MTHKPAAAAVMPSTAVEAPSVAAAPVAVAASVAAGPAPAAEPAPAAAEHQPLPAVVGTALPIDGSNKWRSECPVPYPIQ